MSNLESIRSCETFAQLRTETIRALSDEINLNFSPELLDGSDDEISKQVSAELEARNYEAAICLCGYLEMRFAINEYLCDEPEDVGRDRWRAEGSQCG